MSDKIIVSNIVVKNKGSLVLLCDVELVPWGVIYCEVRYFEQGQNSWIGMPARSWKTKDGEWQSKELVKWKENDVRERFRKAICDKIKEAIANGIDMTPQMDEEVPF